jgi:hypothetical protein
VNNERGWQVCKSHLCFICNHFSCWASVISVIRTPHAHLDVRYQSHGAVQFQTFFFFWSQDPGSIYHFSTLLDHQAVGNMLQTATATATTQVGDETFACEK